MTNRTIACVLKSGGEYGPEHVSRLFYQVDKNTDDDTTFICLADVPLPKMPRIDTIPLIHNWPGWWSKLELFRPGLFSGRVLYLDLDVDIVGPLDPVFDFDAPFAAIKDYINPLKINSSVMVWDAGECDAIYTDFAARADEIMDRLHGDQDWISEHGPYAQRFPRNWFPSYRGQVRDNGVPDGAKAVVFHGRPKSWEIEE